MGSILIRNVRVDDRPCNVLIEGGRFRCLDAAPGALAETVLDGTGKALLPGLYNTHTHSAMTLMRGYGDDHPLKTWLNEYIWPFESHLTREQLAEGYRIGTQEMVRTGTVYYNDMYFDLETATRAAAQSGLRASLGWVVLDSHPLVPPFEQMEQILQWRDPTGGRIQLTLAPHSVYTVSEDKLVRTVRFARENDLKIHIHLAETRKEVEDCVRVHGMRPAAYLDSLGVLGPDTILAHCVHITDEEADLLAERQVTISHCPCSNMKLGSGIFPYERLIKAGCRITLGTDGASSSNNLDLREAMKFAALLAKSTGQPHLLPASQVFEWATIKGAETFGIDGGVIAEGKVADCILVDLEDVKMQPCHNLISNFVYSADSSCIAGVICDGHILYQKS